MTLEEFIASEKALLDKFKLFWGVKVELEDLPTELTQEDWVEQFFGFISLEGAGKL